MGLHRHRPGGDRNTRPALDVDRCGSWPPWSASPSGWRCTPISCGGAIRRRSLRRGRCRRKIA